MPFWFVQWPILCPLTIMMVNGHGSMSKVVKFNALVSNLLIMIGWAPMSIKTCLGVELLVWEKTNTPKLLANCTNHRMRFCCSRVDHAATLISLAVPDRKCVPKLEEECISINFHFAKALMASSTSMTCNVVDSEKKNHHKQSLCYDLLIMINNS